MNALVLGGTGPTGPFVVNGLLQRGYDVTIMHGGFHEVEFAGPVEDLHGDVHFKDSLDVTLGDRKFDVVVFMYGRLRETADFMVGRTDRFIGVGAAGATAGPHDPRWGLLGRPFMVDEDKKVPLDPKSATGGLGVLIQQANEHVMDIHRSGAYNATIIAYPNMYGPRQLAPEDWVIVRRLLDGRRQLVIADGGLKLHQRAYVENAAEAVLLALDKPKESAGDLFVVGEQPLYTMRQRLELIVKTMGLEGQVEFVDMPYPLARPAHYAWFYGPAHVARDDSKIRRVLGYTEKIPVDVAQQLTTEWLLQNQEQFQGEWENQIEDEFDYAAEDKLITGWKKAYGELSSIEFDWKANNAHRYRHPRNPGENWQRPERATSYGNDRGLEYY